MASSSGRLVVVGFFLCVFVVILCTGDRSDPTVTYYAMYHEGREAYTKERWFEAIDFLEKALEDWHWYREELAQCRIKCKRLSEDLSLDKKMTQFDLILAGRWILNAACQKKCKRDKFAGRQTLYDEVIEDDFVQLKPYNYLQLSYYKASRHVTNYQELIATKAHQEDFLGKAVQCAYTYLLSHPDDETMRKNLDFFKSIPAVRDEMFTSREEPRHQKYYKAASAAYDNTPPDFKATRDNMVSAISEYYKAYATCEAHCEKPLTNATQTASNFSEGFTEDLFINIADHMGSFVECVSHCPDNLAMFFGQPLDNYLPNHYHYLQFAAYKVDDTDNAAMACATYLLFHPEDVDMLNNRKFYETKLGIAAEKFAADPNALNYVAHVKEIKTLKSYIDTHYKRKRINVTTSAITIDPSAHDKSKPAITPDQLVPIPKDKLDELKKEFGFALHSDAKSLNGTHRVAVDNLASVEECGRMVELASAGSGGDGYGRFKGTGSHPHTPHESFAGLTVARAAELAEEGTIDWQDAWTFLDMAERSRAVTEKYFQLPSKLFFSFTHLVCRTAETTEAQKTRADLSHPIHADNCNLLEDGTCIYSYPAFTWRDFSSLLYLNDDFVGGDFLFANPDKSIQATLRPAPGRLVAFHNGLDNLHGVKAVTSGRRCALAMWYTMDPAEHEKGQENHEAARNILTNLKIKALGDEVVQSSSSSSSSSSESPPASGDPSSTATPLPSDPAPPLPSSTTTTTLPLPHPADVDEIIASQDAEIEDHDSGGYAPLSMEGPQKHNEL